MYIEKKNHTNNIKTVFSMESVAIDAVIDCIRNVFI